MSVRLSVLLRVLLLCVVCNRRRGCCYRWWCCRGCCCWRCCSVACESRCVLLTPACTLSFARASIFASSASIGGILSLPFPPLDESIPPKEHRTKALSLSLSPSCSAQLSSSHTHTSTYTHTPLISLTPTSALQSSHQTFQVSLDSALQSTPVVAQRPAPSPSMPA